jgi:hypothetical protein
MTVAAAVIVLAHLAAVWKPRSTRSSNAASVWADFGG